MNFFQMIEGFKPLVFFYLFISNRNSDKTGNYSRSIFRQIDSLGDAIGKNITNKLYVLH